MENCNILCALGLLLLGVAIVATLMIKPPSVGMTDVGFRKILQKYKGGTYGK